MMSLGSKTKACLCARSSYWTLNNLNNNFPAFLFITSQLVGPLPVSGSVLSEEVGIFIPILR